jgi:hypothetical protein
MAGGISIILLLIIIVIAAVLAVTVFGVGVGSRARKTATEGGDGGRRPAHTKVADDAASEGRPTDRAPEDA